MRRRFELGLLLAGVAHVALIASLRAPRTRGESATSREIAIEATVLDPSTPPEPPVPTPTELHSSTPPARQAIAIATPTPTSTETPTPNEPPSPPEPITAPSSSAWSAWSLVFKNGAPPSRSTGPGTSAGHTAPAFDSTPYDPLPASSTGGLHEALAQRDFELGLGSGGPVVSPAEEATRLSRTPVNGFGLVIATFGPDGAVVDVHVVDESGDREAWDDVAKEIAQAMRSKRVKIPRGSTGVEVTLRIDTRWQLPDGSDPDPYKLCVAGIPCNASEHRRTITISPLGVMGAVPTSGGGPLRVVHARVVSERAM